MVVTTGMIGRGFCNRNSAPEMAAIDHVLPWLDEAVATLDLSGQGPLGLADFGCSEGRNSIALMSRIVPTLRARTWRDILTIHGDLPTNDFSALFRDLRPEGKPVYDVLNDAVLELVAAGRIERAAYEAYYQLVYFRSLDEVTDVVQTAGLPFRIERAESYESPVPFNEDLERTGDRETYARDCTNFFRAFTEPVLRLAFAADPDLEGLVADVYARAERLVRETPERYPFRYIALALLLTRT